MNLQSEVQVGFLITLYIKIFDKACITVVVNMNLLTLAAVYIGPFVCSLYIIRTLSQVHIICYLDLSLGLCKMVYINGILCEYGE